MASQLVSTAVLCLLAAVEYVHGDTQLPQTNSLGQFKIVGNSLVSAQQVSYNSIFCASIKLLYPRYFSVPRISYTSSTRQKIIPNRLMATPLGLPVFILDSFTAVTAGLTVCLEFSISGLKARPMDIVTNSFCAVRPASPTTSHTY
jgi:hypothetical protein